MAAITDSNCRNHTNNSACRLGNPFRPIKSFYCPTTLMSPTTRGTNRPDYEWSQGGSRGGATLAHICLQPTMVKQMPHTRFPDRMETVFKNTRLTILQCRLWCQRLPYSLTCRTMKMTYQYTLSRSDSKCIPDIMKPISYTHRLLESNSPVKNMCRRA